MQKDLHLSLTLGKRLGLLLCIFIVCYFIVGIVAAILVMKFGIDSTPAMRIMAVIQDLLLFITPALVTAMLVTRTPATLLRIDRKPPVAATLLGVAILLASIPLMNMIVWANENIPVSAELYEKLHSFEDGAEAMITALKGPHTIGNLLMSILIVGIFAGLSEEMLFRGALQRLLMTGGVNVNMAIWVAAVLFSLLHLQFFGFVPRMLLGAFFGYMLIWTRSLWCPIILHAFNNTMYIVSQYCHADAVDEFGAGNNYWAVAISAIVTVAIIAIIHKRRITD